MNDGSSSTPTKASPNNPSQTALVFPGIRSAKPFLSDHTDAPTTMIDVTFGFGLFSCWLAREMWPCDYYDFLAQLTTEEEHY